MDEPSEQRPNPTIEVIIRFSNTESDLLLTVASPALHTGLSLKRLIRANLKPPTSESRLRLIHSGKVIPDTTPLDQTLSPIFPPPRSAHTADPLGHDALPQSARAKGKQPLRDDSPTRAPLARVYVHCAVGDILTTADLSAEEVKAQEAEAALTSTLKDGVPKPKDATTLKDNDGVSSNTTTPAPRGFDRLLSAGFTTAEVANLRAQFLAIQAHSHTPDTMPSGAELLGLEERWLDNGSSGASGEGQEGGGFGGGDDSGGLEDMLYGNLIGFFWPIGAMCWLMREEGVWSRRRQIAVLGGFLVNLTFGWLSAMN